MPRIFVLVLVGTILLDTLPTMSQAGLGTVVVMGGVVSITSYNSSTRTVSGTVVVFTGDRVATDGTGRAVLRCYRNGNSREIARGQSVSVDSIC
jgi:hypothetical protein